MCLPVIYLVLVSCLAIRGQNVKSTATSLSKPAAGEVHSKTFSPTLVVAEGVAVTSDGFNIPNDGDPLNSKKNSHVKSRKDALLNVKSPETSASSEKDSKILLTDKNKAKDPLQIELVLNSTNATKESAKNLQQNRNITNSMGEKVNKQPQHVKKPQILSYDALNNVASSIIKGSTLQELKSSSNPIDSDQIPSPNQGVPNTSFYSNIAAKGPSMVIPIAISLLVLPVVGILGYFGLKKGKEAWKNRHYKRMDFLLDGMYNE